VIPQNSTLRLDELDDGVAYEVALTIKPDTGAAGGLLILDSNGGKIYVGIDQATGNAFIDRTECRSRFRLDFAARHEAPLLGGFESVHLTIFIDTCSVELFVNGGERVISDCIFPEGSLTFHLFSENGNVEIKEMVAWPLEDIHQ
jgi:sucrose-6-phosphate hydrolase SacC (GH32 family)